MNIINWGSLDEPRIIREIGNKKFVQYTCSIDKFFEKFNNILQNTTFNRKIDQNRVDEFYRISIKEFTDIGYTSLFVGGMIVIGKCPEKDNYQMIDGQHRLSVAKKLSGINHPISK